MDALCKSKALSLLTIAQFKPYAKSCNESEQKNELNREFDQKEEMAAIVSDLTYGRVNQKWHYVYVFVDLFNREIIGYSTGPNKDTLLVYRAFSSIKVDLRKIQIFHTDRGNEFKNKLIDDALKTLNIQR
jgi:putative transposase